MKRNWTRWALLLSFIIIGTFALFQALGDQPRKDQPRAARSGNDLTADSNELPSTSSSQAADILPRLSIPAEGDQGVFSFRYSYGMEMDLKVALAQALPMTRAGQETNTLGTVRTEMRLSGKLHWRGIRRHSSGALLVGLQLHDIEAETEAAGVTTAANGTDLQQPFYLLIEDDGSFRRIGFTDAALGEDVRSLLHGLVTTFEVRHPKVHAPSWLLSQQDAHGSYLVRYSTRDEDPAGLFRRRVLRYFAADADTHAEPNIEVVRSTGSIEISSRTSWMERFSANDLFRIHPSEGELLGNLTRSLQLHYIPGAEGTVPDPPTADIVWFNSGELRAPGLSIDANPDLRETHLVDSRLKEMTLDQALEEVMAIFQLSGRSGARTARHLLTDYLRARPGAAKDLLTRICAGALDPSTRSIAFLSLQRCGTPQAREALVGAMRSETNATDDRTQAMLTLSLLQPAPGEEVARSMMSMGASAELPDASQAEKELADAALRGGGILASRLEDTAPELAEELKDELRAKLESASDSTLASAIAGIGNSKDPVLVESTAAFVSDPRGGVRHAAIKALRWLPADRVVTLMRDEGSGDDGDIFQETWLSTLEATLRRTGEVVPQEVIELAAQGLSGPSEDLVVRTRLIRILGAAAAQGDHTAEAALVHQFHLEQERSLRLLIGQFVSAEALFNSNS